MWLLLQLSPASCGRVFQDRSLPQGPQHQSQPLHSQSPLIIRQSSILTACAHRNRGLMDGSLLKEIKLYNHSVLEVIMRMFKSLINGRMDRQMDLWTDGRAGGQTGKL